MNDSNLGRRRAAQGITQQKLAERLEVTVTHLCRIERGRAKPSSDLANRIARRLKLTETGFWKLWKDTRAESIHAEMKDARN